MKYLIFTLLLLACCQFSFAQKTIQIKPEHRKWVNSDYTLLASEPLAPPPSLSSSATERRRDEILVQLTDGADVQRVVVLLNAAGGGTVALKKTVAPDWNVHVISFDENQVVANDFLTTARRTPGVRFAQWNHRAPERATPNDPGWSQQDDMTLIGAPEAWDINTGGLAFTGDTIVVAVLEKGALLTHPDLAPNRWHNWAEIPGNGLDDDNNGYMDDFAGWDAENDGDNSGTNNHGTAVHGIIGARGNNSTGVTGVNWTVQLMGISNTEYESQIIAAYQYAAKMRRLYNQTNGAKGAFVVATNASFGLDKEKAEDHPLWCAAYDSLGQVGILSVGATTNQNTDVDMEGDIPTSCTSEFLISVNNTDKTGTKASSTGYGSLSIDLGAPGDQTYTTANNGFNNPGYGTLGGTSTATPHVTGAVALLYSVPCSMLTGDALSAPVTCARRVRDILLDNVEPEPSLAGKTVTGGYLQIAKAATAAKKLCDDVLNIVEVKSSADKKFQVSYLLPSSGGDYYFRIFNMLGQLMHEEKLPPGQSGINFWEYDGRYLPAGIYVMTLGREKTIVSRKFRKI